MQSAEASVAHRRAWWAVASIPVFLVVAFAVGEGVRSLLGYPSGSDIPLWASLVTDLAVLLVCALPAVVAIVLGRRARRGGVSSALAPAVIGAVVIAAVLVLTIVTEIGDAR